MVTTKTVLKAEAALATILVDGSLDLWPDDKRKIEAALEVIRKLVQAASD